jgi:surfactin synthase thioesterase subunit
VTGPTAGRWLRRFHPAAPGAPRLVCLPYAGGSASYFFPVSAALAPAAEVVAVQYPGRQDRRTEPALTDLGALADHVTTALRAEPPAPTVLFGHSMGAVVGYEVARRLDRAGTPARHLVVSGRRPPDGPRPGEDLHTRDDAALLAELTALGGPGTDLLADPDLRALAMPAIRGDHQAVETYAYEPGPPLRCPVTVLLGDRDPKTPLAEAAGWADHTTGPVDQHVFPGDHFFLGHHLDAVLTTLRTALRLRLVA